MAHMVKIYFIFEKKNLIFLDRRQAEESQTFIADLETIDDDLSTRGVNMVKISDLETAEDYGIEDLPTVVYFENGIPFVYMGKIKAFKIVTRYIGSKKCYLLPMKEFSN